MGVFSLQDHGGSVIILHFASRQVPITYLGQGKSKISSVRLNLHFFLEPLIHKLRSLVRHYGDRI